MPPLIDAARVGRHARRALRCLPRRVRRVPGAAPVVSAARRAPGARPDPLRGGLADDRAAGRVRRRRREARGPAGRRPRTACRARSGSATNRSLFLSLNSGKRSVALDFRSPSAAEAVDRLLGSSDFLVENARPGSLAPLRPGLGAGARALSPRSSTARSPATATSVRDAARGGFDLILQAESGVMSVTGSEASGPVKVGAPVLDVGAGLSCAFGLLAAHLERLRTGVGAPRVLLADGVRAGQPRHPGGDDVRLRARCPGLLGTHSPTFAPYGGFRTADGWIVARGCGLGGPVGPLLPGARAPTRSSTIRGSADNASRVRHRDELTRAFEDVLRDGAERALAGAARGRRRAGRGGPRHRAGVRRARRPRRSARSRTLHHPRRGRLSRGRRARAASTASRSPTRRRRPRSARTRARS